MDSQSLMAPFQRRSRALILSFTAAILVAVGLLVGTDLWRSDQRSLDLAEKRAANLSYMLTESDIEMPDCDGYELLQAIRDHGSRDPSFPSIAVTACVRDVDRRRALDAGFDAHLAKPVEPADLVGAVASLASTPDVARGASDPHGFARRET